MWALSEKPIFIMTTTLDKYSQSMCTCNLFLLFPPLSHFIASTHKNFQLKTCKCNLSLLPPPLSHFQALENFSAQEM